VGLFAFGQLLAFLLGVLACLAFWAAMQRLRPDLRIAPIVAFNPKSQRLGIKVANWGRRTATDIQVHIATASRPAAGIMTTRKKASLRWSSVLALEPKQKNDLDPWGLPTTFIFVAENATEMLDDLEASPGDRRIVFTITGRDAWSGTASVQRVTFLLTAVVRGWYKRGLTFEILPAERERVEAPSPSTEAQAVVLS
jgi:hypothetical protein